MDVTEKTVRDALKTVKDPELNLDLVTLGLVYDIEVDGSDVKATISMTTPMCPAAGQIMDDAKAAIQGVEGVESADQVSLLMGLDCDLAPFLGLKIALVRR